MKRPPDPGPAATVLPVPEPGEAVDLQVDGRPVATYVPFAAGP